MSHEPDIVVKQQRKRDRAESPLPVAETKKIRARYPICSNPKTLMHALENLIFFFLSFSFRVLNSSCDLVKQMY